jgi:chromosome segregation ATPase
VAYYFAKFMESLQGQTNEEIGSLKAKSERLEKAVLELKQQRDSWEGDANFVKGQLQESEQGRHEAEAKLEEMKKQVTTLENEKAKVVEDMELKDKTLEQEQELKKVHLGKLGSMQMELEQLRTFKKQFLSLASSVEGGGSAK